MRRTINEICIGILCLCVGFVLGLWVMIKVVEKTNPDSQTIEKVYKAYEEGRIEIVVARRHNLTTGITTCDTISYKIIPEKPDEKIRVSKENLRQ